ncbi:peptidylprolyl isomerase [Sphingomonas jaspsi]|uniref:peptidylprolyl isomerase n=1 Tax=Sphingomonas jaspsi TaxID=392409 RepID=UPI0004B1D5FA|nr:peptidylprolyl isomerase [Sphingomonas jaspsi]
MFAAMRRLSKSKFGTAIFVAFLLTILASFALADMNSFGNKGAKSGVIAEIGDEQVTDRDLSTASKQALNQLRQQNPTADYSALATYFDDIVNGLIDEHTIAAFAADHGFVLSKRLVDAEIASNPNTRGLDGKFSEQAYAAFLQQAQLTDADLRRLISSSLIQRQIVAPAAINYKVPLGVARPYASMLLEKREGELGLVAIDQFAAGLNPSDGDLQAYYSANRQRYQMPEQRVLKYAPITLETVKPSAPTDAEVTAYYNANKASYAGNESRVISQAVVQDKAVADGIAARARGGQSFAAAAAPAGLSAEDISVGPQTKAAFTGLATAPVANAAFAANAGAIVGPIKSDLGWHVIKVESIKSAAGKSVEQARSEIVAKLAADKKKAALSEAVGKIQDAIDDGSSFDEAAKSLGLPVTTTPMIDSGGKDRKNPAYVFPAALQPALKTGFELVAGDDPDVATLPNDAGFVLVGVDTIADAAPAPLADIKDRVRADWIKSKATDRARAVAAAIAAKVAKGMSMTDAVKQAGVPLPPVTPVNAVRIQLSQANADAVTALRMLFALSQGKSRMVADPQGRGFFIVKTNKIVPGDSSNQPNLVAQTAAEFQQTAGEELARQFVTAMAADQKVKRNEEAIKAAKQRITGTAK